MKRGKKKKQEHKRKGSKKREKDEAAGKGERSNTTKKGLCADLNTYMYNRSTLSLRIILRAICFSYAHGNISTSMISSLL